IPAGIVLTTDAAAAVAGADLVVAAIPTVYLRATLGRVAADVRSAAPWLSLAKGIENVTFLRPTEVLHQVAGVTRLAVLSGPSHAEEVSRGLPTTVVAA